MKNCTGIRCIMQLGKVDPATCPAVGYCQQATPPTTNADRIRSMTDEELAEFIGDDPMYDICPNNCHEDLDRPCKVCALDWLKEALDA